MHSDVLNNFKSSTTPQCVTHRERLKYFHHISASASKSLDNFEEMFPLYHTDSDVQMFNHTMVCYPLRRDYNQDEAAAPGS